MGSHKTDRRAVPDPAPSTRAVALCAAALVAWCGLCLDVAQRLEHETVARWELAADGDAPMSCADEPRSSDEPLWCANPEAPHCTRGAPAPSASESWLGPMFALSSSAPPRSRRALASLSTRSSAGSGLGYARVERERLERPPRHA